jgi:putative chitinase
MLHKKYKSLFENYKVNTDLRLAHFYAQIDHESGMKPISENLMYSAEALGKVFRKYFPTPVMANKYARQSEKIANIVYSNRMGNGNNESGDGWKYRGRGFIQITGKSNYIVLSKDTMIDYLNKPELLLNEPDALISALWYWNKNKLNTLADKDDLDAISDLINIGRLTDKEGDANGFKDRKEKLNKWKKLLL